MIAKKNNEKGCFFLECAKQVVRQLERRLFECFMKANFSHDFKILCDVF